MTLREMMTDEIKGCGYLDSEYGREYIGVVTLSTIQSDYIDHLNKISDKDFLYTFNRVKQIETERDYNESSDW